MRNVQIFDRVKYIYFNFKIFFWVRFFKIVIQVFKYLDIFIFVWCLRLSIDYQGRIFIVLVFIVVFIFGSLKKEVLFDIFVEL